jgi:hypothetical protein
MKKRNEKVRPWAYRIWTDKTRQPLVTRMPKDGNELEALIEEHGELVVAVAWASFVHADPPVYNLEPVNHVDEWITKKGNKMIIEHEDQSAITKFPLASFLKVSDGYIFASKDKLFDEDFKKTSEHREYAIPGDVKSNIITVRRYENRIWGAVQFAMSQRRDGF